MAFDYSNPYGIESGEDLNIKNFKEISELDNNTFLIGYNSETDEDIKILGTAIGGQGTIDYNDLENKPFINGTPLIGNLELEDLGIQPAGNYLECQNNLKDLTDIETARNNLQVYSKSEVDKLISDITIDTPKIENTIINFGETKNLILFKNGNYKIIPEPNTILNVKIKVNILVNNCSAEVSIGFMTLTDKNGNVSASDVYFNIKNAVGNFDWESISFDVQYFDDKEDSLVISVTNNSEYEAKFYTIPTIKPIELGEDNPEYVNTIVDSKSEKQLSLFKDGTTFIDAEPSRIYNIRINSIITFEDNVKYSKIDFLIYTNATEEAEISEVIISDYNTIGDFDWDDVIYTPKIDVNDPTKVILIATNNSNRSLSYFVNTVIKEIKI